VLLEFVRRVLSRAKFIALIVCEVDKSPTALVGCALCGSGVKSLTEGLETVLIVQFLAFTPQCGSDQNVRPSGRRH
jgi:hypothetical protein